MVRPAFTVQAFGAYAMATGLLLMTAPQLLLVPLGFAPPQELWIRMVGVLAAVLGAYYWAMGAADVRAFFRATLWGRALFALACLGLVLAANAPWTLLLFGALDLAGAAWTAGALRAHPEEN
ncbi:MAG: hypothetical protein U1E77_12965 [Inhella sp.]